MNPVSLLKMVQHSSQAQCREMGQILLDLSKSPRDDRWKASLDAAICTIKEMGLADAVEAADAD